MAKGGIHISLEEEELKRTEEKKAEELKDKETESGEKRQKANEMYWAYMLYVLGSGPALISLLTLLTGPYIYKVEARCTNQPLSIFVQLSIVLAYLYLFLYAWMLLGPFPFRSQMGLLKKIFGVIAVLATGVYGYGIALLYAGSACAIQAPRQYAYCKMQLVFFLLGSLFAMYKLAKDAYDEQKLKKKKADRAKLKATIQAEKETSEEDEETGSVESPPNLIE